MMSESIDEAGVVERDTGLNQRLNDFHRLASDRYKVCDNYVQKQFLGLSMISDEAFRRSFDILRSKRPYLADSLSDGYSIFWRKIGKCRDADPAIFFPGHGVNIAKARKICFGCVVRAECLEYALQADSETSGVWGGTSERERRKIRRDRAMGRAAAKTG
jgi:WhiB family redox-sensing transcriptional regulator